MRLEQAANLYVARRQADGIAFSAGYKTYRAFCRKVGNLTLFELRSVTPPRKRVQDCAVISFSQESTAGRSTPVPLAAILSDFGRQRISLATAKAAIGPASGI